MRKQSGTNGLERYRKEISRCVKCGSCSAVCPSFRADRRESRSPRGRMALVEAVLDGRLAVSTVYRDRLATCTGCLACEAQCPAGVPVTTIIHAAKEQAVAEAGPGIVGAAIAAPLRHPFLMRSLAWLAPLALHYSAGAMEGQGSGGKAHRKNVPASPRPRVSASGPKGTVAFFPGCAITHFQQDIGRAAAAVLEALGHEVIVPDGLVCCGRPFLSLGDREAAGKLARTNIEALSAGEADIIVTACATCGLMLKREYAALLGRSARLPVLDIHELLAGPVADLELEAGPVRVTVHDACHLNRGQGISSAVRHALRAVPGADLVEMEEPARCCGFGGVMRATHPGLSKAIGSEKAQDIIRTGASLVVTGCPGCRMQITDALRTAGSDAAVVHTVQVIEKALRNADRGLRIARVEPAGRER